MKYTLIILSLFTTTILFGQKTKKIKNTVKEQFREYKEVYYVLKSDKKTKHGLYLKKNTQNNNVVESGYFKNGLKDSIWSYYYPFSKKQTLKSQGNFKNNTKSGEWNFYDRQGVLMQTYDFTKDTILFNKTGTYQYKYTCSISTSTDSCLKPVIIGGYTTIQEIIIKHLIYPPLAIENQIQGSVYVSFEIDENGKGKNLELHKGIDPDLDAETLRVMKIILEEVRWYTWRQKNTFKVTMPIKFKLY